MRQTGRGILIDNKHTRADWGLIPTAIEIGMPEPKIVSIDIPGGDGSIDLTEALTGEVSYKDRRGSFTFDMIDHYKKWPFMIESIAAFCHGRKRRVVLPNDPNWFYISRITINSFKSNRTIGKLAMSVTSEPFKYKINPTVYRITTKGNPLLLACENARKRAIPVLTASSDYTVEFEERVIQMPAGAARHTSIVFKEGRNEIRFTAPSGTDITVAYWEGAF